ncbi:40S ribosomal protein S30 [Emergomyces pasteurianus Ep9510]|uniref:40S ribosomal protein S30 n=1 Tax=Emergomyces pasteurianus Ep9510 TaxID=1447872 RepID=A0A1J9PDJ9_9EURO|nr:40S ribosomal protein S30 [Emergomyces pasteurianus Ep9510]
MGKVHGSLARAGKVKSQTPKVEPQEKKKTPKGRAKKRLQHTRRFVNVTMTGGKRKVRFLHPTCIPEWRWATSRARADIKCEEKTWNNRELF